MSKQTLRVILLVLLLWAAGLGAAAQFAKISVAFGDIREMYPSAGAEVGWLLSVISLIGAIFGMFAGVVVSKFGFRRLLVSAMVLGGLISLYQATLPAFWPMLVSRIVEGVSHLCIVVAAPTLIAQTSAGRFQGAAMTLWSTFFGVAFALVAWLGTPLVASYGIEGLFLSHGVYMLLIGALLMLSLRMITPVNATAPLSLRGIIAQHRTAYGSPYIAAPAVGWLFYTLTFVSLLTVLPELMAAEERLLAQQLMPIASILVALLVVTPLLRFMSAVNVVIIGFAVSALVLMLAWSGVGIVLIAIGVFGTLGLVQGASFAAIPQLNKDAESIARANGAMAQMGNIGNMTGTPLLLAVLAAGGVNGLIVAVVALYVLAVAAHLWLARRRA